MSLFGENTANQKAHCVGRPGQSWTSSAEVKPLAGPSEGSLVRPSLRTAFFTWILKEEASAVARTSHPFGPRVTSQNISTTSTRAIPWRQVGGRRLWGEVGGSLMWSRGLGHLPELELGPQVGLNVPVPSPTRLHCSDSPAPDGRPVHSGRSARLDHVALPWEMGETTGVSGSPALLTLKTLLPP